MKYAVKYFNGKKYTEKYTIIKAASINEAIGKFAVLKKSVVTGGDYNHKDDSYSFCLQKPCSKREYEYLIKKLMHI